MPSGGLAQQRWLRRLFRPLGGQLAQDSLCVCLPVCAAPLCADLGPECALQGNQHSKLAVDRVTVGGLSVSF